MEKINTLKLKNVIILNYNEIEYKIKIIIKNARIKCYKAKENNRRERKYN